MIKILVMHHQMMQIQIFIEMMFHLMHHFQMEVQFYELFQAAGNSYRLNNY